jgi:hypothetical protein
MRARAVHRVYAEEEQPTGLHEDERPGESSEEKRLGGRHLMQPAWRSPQRGRAMAIALLAAGLAFVVALAIHVFSGPHAVTGGQEASGTGLGGSQATSVVASQRLKTRPRFGKAVPRRAHKWRVEWRMGQGAVRAQARQAQPPRMPAGAPGMEEHAVAPRVEERAAAYSSATQIAPAVARRSAESEFSFER